MGKELDTNTTEVGTHMLQQRKYKSPRAKLSLQHRAVVGLTTVLPVIDRASILQGLTEVLNCRE